MKVLVTGATGFLGHRLSLKLKEMGFDVYGMGRNISNGKKLSKAGCEFVNVDLSNKRAVIDACAGMDYIFHCAAKSSAWGTWKSFYESNVVGTKNIIEGAKIANIKRLIHVSSPSIYFKFKDEFDIKETDVLPKKCVNYYAQTKKLAEDEIDKAHKEGLPVITIRPRGIFGVGDTALLPRLIRANNKRFIPKIANDDILIDITHVDNVVEALILCMKSDKSTLGEKYNITNDEPIKMYAFLEDLINKLGHQFRTKKISEKKAMLIAGAMEFISKYFMFYKEPVFTKYTVGVLSKSQTLDISKAKEELNYKPIISIKEGIEEVVKGYLHE